jgi:hypothetical protein
VDRHPHHTTQPKKTKGEVDVALVLPHLIAFLCFQIHHAVSIINDEVPLRIWCGLDRSSRTWSTCHGASTARQACLAHPPSAPPATWSTAERTAKGFHSPWNVCDPAAFAAPKYKAYKFSQKSNLTKFDQIFTEKYKHLQYWITYCETILYGQSIDIDLIF